MARKPYILCRNPKSKYLYVRLWDEDLGKYKSGKTTGEKTKAKATIKVMKLLSAGGIYQSLPVAQYLRDFWVMNGDYVKGRIARGGSMSKMYVSSSSQRVEKYILPLIEKVCGSRARLDKLKPAQLETILMALHDGNRTSRTANAIFQTLQVPLEEAARLGLISENPAKRVRKLAEIPAIRGILTGEEAKSFFKLEWEDYRAYTANLLAATTGMRLGEVLGLQISNVQEGLINVFDNWQDLEGLKLPKWNHKRSVPVPKITAKALSRVIDANPWGGPFVFYGSNPDRPMSDNVLRNAFKEGLKLIGVDDTKRSTRNLTFHSWRHFYNSMLRGKIDDHALRMLTGHHSEPMTDKYSHITAEQRAAVTALANGLV